MNSAETPYVMLFYIPGKMKIPDNVRQGILYTEIKKCYKNNMILEPSQVYITGIQPPLPKKGTF